eukprot:372390-Rhodomonas_salina.1
MVEKLLLGSACSGKSWSSMVIAVLISLSSCVVEYVIVVPADFAISLIIWAIGGEPDAKSMSVATLVF